jgi:uncharacterized protein (TIGR02145 family)
MRIQFLQSYLIITACLFCLVGCVEINPSDVKIGNQFWMSKNLNSTTFKNGDPIPQAISTEAWNYAAKKKLPVWCYYENNIKNGEKFGKLYNWYAVNDPRGLGPKGYHVPSDHEWSILYKFLGYNEESGNKLKSQSDWKNNGKGSNSSKFDGLPGGYRVNTGGAFVYLFYNGNFWSSTSHDKTNAWGRGLVDYNGNFTRFYDHKSFGFSVRCIKNADYF